MLTRIYIDNFRCFVNFEYRPGRRQLILGANGSGKSSLLDALLFLRRVVELRQDLDKRKILREKTLGINRPTQTFELEASLDDASYIYRLVIDSYGDPPQARIVSESVKLNGKPIFEFEDGKVHLFNDQFEHQIVYPSDRRRSALANIADYKDNRKLIRFKEWFGNLLCFRVNPFRMTARTEDAGTYPYFDLRNFAAWYPHLWQSSPGDNEKLWDSLRAALEGFDVLKLDRAKSLVAEFKSSSGPAIELELDKLSDGQRCLIGLYNIVHFVLSKGNTIIFDEPY